MVLLSTPLLLNFPFKKESNGELAAAVPTFLYGAAHREGRTLASIRRQLGYFKPNSSGDQWRGALRRTPCCRTGHQAGEAVEIQGRAKHHHHCPLLKSASVADPSTPPLALLHLLLPSDASCRHPHLVLIGGGGSRCGGGVGDRRVGTEAMQSLSVAATVGSKVCRVGGGCGWFGRRLQYAAALGASASFLPMGSRLDERAARYAAPSSFFYPAPRRFSYSVSDQQRPPPAHAAPLLRLPSPPPVLLLPLHSPPPGRTGSCRVAVAGGGCEPVMFCFRFDSVGVSRFGGFGVVFLPWFSLFFSFVVTVSLGFFSDGFLPLCLLT